ncbi:hypothetical protein [Apilactobacillus timberlakei]|uniref:Uncharacterized protein n=1 Tax=Apilactobacillus timberlakei TaxID=2008380 RepID=A0ABY2YSI4_9LACO|nr:hypothetical protein [Apilactobacillus timberlakei]TPR14132.1 hypothetical protein DY048_04085 [Apilactobacillus timberlakei]TPR16386.1 hypothetical protein DY052_02180 [Apilactobacillus timberlakei]
MVTYYLLGLATINLKKTIAGSTSLYNNYTHVRIFIDDNFIHANPKNGCVKQSLDEFISEQKVPIDILNYE